MERSCPTSGRPATPADINRNSRPTSIVMGGRLQSECPADIIGIRSVIRAATPQRHPDHQPNPGRPLARPDRRAHTRRRHPRPHRSQYPSSPAPRRQFAQAEGAENRHRLTRRDGHGRDDIQPPGDPPPRPTSIGTADFNRNRWPTSIGMPGRHNRNPQRAPRSGQVRQKSVKKRVDLAPRLDTMLTNYARSGA